MKKVDVERTLWYRLMHPMHTVLATCVDRAGRPKIITLAWAMPISARPPMLAVCVAPARYSHALIAEAREFTVNVPTAEIADKVMFCGVKSGRDGDKFQACGLTPRPAKVVKPPVIQECVAHLECRVTKQIDTGGSHTLFLAEIVAGYADEDAFTSGELDNENVRTLYSSDSRLFTTAPQVLSQRID